MAKEKEKAEEKLNFSTIEIILMVVMVALVVVSAITVVSITTRKQNIDNLKKDAISIVAQAKNAYAGFIFKFEEDNEYIVQGEDGLTKAMCITLDGLYENGYATKPFEDADGYVVIEESPNHQYNYTIWYTNKKYVIDGYDSEQLSTLDINKGITKYNNDSFSTKVRTSFTGTTADKGGTAKGNTPKRYEAVCINEKVE